MGRPLVSTVSGLGQAGAPAEALGRRAGVVVLGVVVGVVEEERENVLETVVLGTVLVLEREVVRAAAVVEVASVDEVEVEVEVGAASSAQPVEKGSEAPREM